MADNEGWLSPLNKIILRRAFVTKAPQVVLRDGTKFNLDYERKPGKIHISPATLGEIVPRGWLDYKKVTDDTWLSE